MQRHLHLLGIFWKSMLLNELEYRVNFLVNMLVGLAWSLWALAGATFFYQYRDSIRGWSYYQALVVLGLFMFFTGLVNAFMRPNLERLAEHIRSGTLDFVLIKPVNAQFYASLREISVWVLSDILIGASVVVYALSQLGVQPSLMQVGLFLVLIVAAGLTLYSLVLMLATTAFWAVQVDNILELLFSFYEAGRFPVTIYPQWLRILLTFVVPIAFVTTVPAEAMLGRLADPWMVVYALAIGAGLFVLSAAYWRFALRHYSSASS
jgi:ABC-2 type transport system permease protein